MEKQPIDDLFARKLREAQLSPNPDAFSRLQSRMASTELPTTKRRSLVWWYSAAAASLVLITLFYYRSASDVEHNVPVQLAEKKSTKKSALSATKYQSDQLIAGAESQVKPDMDLGKQTSVGQRGRKSLIAKLRKLAEEETKAIAVAEKEPVQRGTSQSPEPISITTNNESVAVAVPPVPAQMIQLKTAALINASDHQRVVVMVIEEAQPNVKVVASQPTKAESTSQAQSGNLAGLFAKVKQLKNGDVMARAVNPPATHSRSRLGRVFEGMKESLKNETTLD